MLAAPLPLLTATPPAPAITDNAATLTVASANVGLGNPRPADILSWLDSQGVEVAALFEVTPAFADQLQASSAFPYTKIIATQDPFGIALLARFPFERVEVLEAMHGITQIEARFRWQEKESRVVAVHPAPPIDPSLMQERDVLLEQRAAGIVADGTPAILLGDLNATPWSAAFKGPTLHGLRRVTGLAPTWPSELRGLMGIPIDHVLVSAHWGVVETLVGPAGGSDHFPVVARLATIRLGLD